LRKRFYHIYMWFYKELEVVKLRQENHMNEDLYV